MMKYTTKKLFGILLILAGILAIYAALSGMKDCEEIRAYKAADAKEAERIGELEDAIYALKKNEKTYFEGVAAYAEVQREIEENTAAYIEGKEKLAQLQSMMPYVDSYIAQRDSLTNKLLGGLISSVLFDTLQQRFVNTVRPIAAQSSIDVPDDVTDFPAYMQRMMTESEAQLAEYEKVFAQLAEAEKELTADGLEQLDTFEDSVKQIDQFTEFFFVQETVYRYNGEVAVRNVMDRLGADFNWMQSDSNDKHFQLRNGDPYLDTDKCLLVCRAFRDFCAEQVEDVAREIQNRTNLYYGMLGLSALSVIAGVIGLIGNKGWLFGMITALGAVGVNVYGALGRYTGYTYQLRDRGADGEYLLDVLGEYAYTYSGTLQLFALLTIAAVAVTFAALAIAAKKKTADTLLPE